MSKYTNAGEVFTVDNGGNVFRGNKLDNPMKDSSLTVQENARLFTSLDETKPLSLVVGHVPNFEYGYGENRVVVNTGKKAW
jgi:hypothetical protein